MKSLDAAKSRFAAPGDGRRDAVPGLVLAMLLDTLAAPALGASFEFVPAPQIDLNRVYRVDKVTGEVTSCQYGLREGGGIGQTLCFGPGEGAGSQAPSEYGLVAYVFTENTSRTIRVAEGLEFGMVGINQGVVSNPSAPFGGVKHSGFGREGGFEGIEEYLETKYVGMAL